MKEKIRDTILIVDDNEINRIVLRNIFEKDYSVLEAGNGEQALLLLDQYHSSIACLLLDLIMPVKGGYEVMEEMDAKKYLSELPVIIITAEDSAANEIRAFDMGASDIIIKPFEPHVVKRRVQNAIDLNEQRHFSKDKIKEQALQIKESSSS